MTTTVEAARERVNLALREVGRLQLRLQELTTDMDREVDRARSAYAARIQTAQEKLSAAEAALGAYASEHRAELLPGSKIKSFHLLFGTIAWRYDPPRVELARGVDADAAAQRLRDLGHGAAHLPHPNDRQSHRVPLLKQPETSEGTYRVPPVTGKEPITTKTTKAAQKKNGRR